MKIAHFALSSGILGLFALSTQAQWSSDASANLALADSSASQVQAKVVAADAGGSFFSWFDSDPSGSPAFGFDVRVQHLDSGGHELFTHGGVLVADRGFSSTQDYGLDVDSQGNGLVTFRDDRFAGTQITAAKVDAVTGALVWGSAGVQLTNTTAFVASPKIAGTSDGGSVVAWTQDSDTHLMKLDAAGGNVWANDVVLSPSTDNYGVSDLQTSDAGGVVVSFVQSGSFSSPRHLLAQKLDANGNLLWGANHVTVFDASSLQFGNFPTFVSDENGGAVFGWYSNSPLESYAQRVLADGSEVFPHNGVSASTNAAQIRVDPLVAYDSSTQETFLFYNELNSLQSQFGVSVQKYDAAGNRQFTSTGKVIVPLGSSTIFDVGGLALGGDSMVFWSAEPSFGQGQVMSATLDTTGNITAGPLSVSSTPASKTRLLPALASTGVALLVWGDDRAGNTDIYAQDVLADGSLGGLSSVVSRNGSGANSLSFTSLSSPIVGTNWDAQVDSSGHPGAILSAVVAFSLPSSGIVIPAGELLVDVTSSLLTSSSVTATGTDTVSFAIPNDASMIGLGASTQAVILGGGAELTNALDVVLGL